MGSAIRSEGGGKISRFAVDADAIETIYEVLKGFRISTPATRRLSCMSSE